MVKCKKGVISGKCDHECRRRMASGMIIKEKYLPDQERKKEKEKGITIIQFGIDVQKIDGGIRCFFFFSLTIESKHHNPVIYPVYRIVDIRKWKISYLLHKSSLRRKQHEEASWPYCL